MQFAQKLRAERLVGWFNGNIAFPVKDRDGTVTGCHYRGMQTSGSPTWLFTKGTKARALVIGDPLTATRVFAFESQWDAFACMDKLRWHDGALNDVLIVITRGAANGNQIEGWCREEVTLFAFKQNDPCENGRDPAGKWLDAICKHAGCAVRLVATPATHKDLNDWTREAATEQDIRVAINASTVAVNRAMQLTGENTGAYDLDDERPWIQLPDKGRLHSEFASEMGEVFAEISLYNHGGYPMLLDLRVQALRPISTEHFRTWVEQFVVCYHKEEPKAGGTLQIRQTMSSSVAGATLASDQFLRKLKPIKKLNKVRLPVLRNSGAIELLPDGYDTESQTVTLPCLLNGYPKEMSLDEAVAALRALFAEFCFGADGGLSLAVAVSAMLTLFARGLLPPSAIVPCFFILANAEGAGKTLLVKTIQVPVLGYCPLAVIPTNDEEVRKELLCVVMEGKPVLVFDNVRSKIASSALEAFLTSHNWTGRVLGSSKIFTGEKSTVVFITGNGCEFTPDLKRRSLFCQLFMTAEFPESRKFQRQLNEVQLLAERSEILSALHTLVRVWNERERPPCSRTHSSFPEWAAVIGGIVECAGFSCPVALADIEVGGDTNHTDMRRLIIALVNTSLLDEASGQVFIKRVPFCDLVALARREGLFEGLLPDEGDELDRKAKTTFSRILKRFDRRMLAGYWFKADGQGHGRRYVIERQIEQNP